ncbi:MAG: hypothetical protein J6O50_10295, partial [Ruminiclostridium sp.]|nr:hypothetical protein [Ruminiclostridium sp.]
MTALKTFSPPGAPGGVFASISGYTSKIVNKPRYFMPRKPIDGEFICDRLVAGQQPVRGGCPCCLTITNI